VKEKSIFQRVASTLNWFLWLGFFTVLVVAFTPLTGYMWKPLMIEEDVRNADLIVVLTGGVNKGRYLSPDSMQRMVRGGQLYFEGRAKKILFSGGICEKAGVTEASVLAQEAKRLNIPVADILLEKNSRRLYERAAEVKKIANAGRWKSILLVTSHWQMKRAVLVFENVGFKVYPAPAAPYEKYVEDPLSRLRLFHHLLQEYVSMIYYRIRGWI